MSLYRIMSFITVICSMVMALYLSYLYQPVAISQLLMKVKVLLMDENKFFILAIIMAFMGGILTFSIKYINKENPIEDNRTRKDSIKIRNMEESISYLKKKVDLNNLSGDGTKGSVELSDEERMFF